MSTMMEKWFGKHDATLSRLLKEFEEVKTSVRFLSDKYDNLEKNTIDVRNRVQAFEKKMESNEPRIADLEAKLESMEQRARNCNLEISNLPEKRGENLISIIENIAQVIKLPMSTRDIVNIHRVPQSSPNITRPKNIVVKFASQITRDNFISATRLNKGLESEQLNIQGPSRKIYINEHLTLNSKKLFRKARDLAREAGFKFAWIKHGVILVRADVTTPAFAIRTEKDLSKLKPNSHLH
ncbi:uncharacterized protein LOC114366013 [Ostrinia furnacalis]|uniref:uncharacterized protein LOC114366013 n=1 Tax=Ostrinia furnacalis TaxID=93504 RepID=UPI001038C96A|nr:uncharacterized protein LOC114366013 [Ostrinia furnacalis]